MPPQARCNPAEVAPPSADRTVEPQAVMLAEDLPSLPNRGEPTDTGKPVPLDGLQTGSGFARGWFVQNSSVAGYAVERRPGMVYRDLLVSGAAIVGGDSFQAAGRPLQLAKWEGLTHRVDQNGGEITVLGAPGASVYVAVLLEKAGDNDQMVYVSLHGSSVSWLSGERVVGFGYFGEASQKAGARVWSLEVAPAGQRERVLLPSTVGVEPGKPALLVVGIHFDVAGVTATATTGLQPGPSTAPAGGAAASDRPASQPGGASRVELYVNPVVLGGEAPARPDVVYDLPTDQLRVHSLAIHLGDAAGQGAVAAIRVGKSFASVTPTTKNGEAPPR